MKPLILGMGPSRLYPTDAWHPDALSTANLCRIITGTASAWTVVQDHFETADLNERWHWVEGLGDSIHPDEAEKTLRDLISKGALRGGRKTFLLGEQVTDFVFSFFRRADSLLSKNAWRRLRKCSAVRLRTDDDEARTGMALSYYDFGATPVWHPRILLDSEVRMPPDWKQRMMSALRAAGGLPPMKFSRPQHPDAEKRTPVGPQLPVW